MGDKASWLFGSWDAVLRVALVGALAYAWVVILLRVSGNRTLAKTAAFDHVVTVALGSILATALLSKQVALIEGTAGFLLLVALQFGVAWLAARSPRFQALLVQEPAVLLRDGQLIPASMRRARVSEADVHSALRKSGLGRLEDAELVVLESDGTFSVLRAQPGRPATVLAGLEV